MQNTKLIVLELHPPLLPGSISTAKSTCGKPNCACKGTPPKLHGVYYRWTGFLEGKRTTKTLSKEVAEECERRIQKYHNLLRQIEKMLDQGLAQAPWKESHRVRRTA
jgi:hypothetical protein